MRQTILSGSFKSHQHLISFTAYAMTILWIFVLMQGRYAMKVVFYPYKLHHGVCVT